MANRPKVCTKENVYDDVVFAMDSDEDIDLSSWEVINPSDDDKVDDYTFDFEDEVEEISVGDPLGSPPADLSMQSPPPDDIVDDSSDLSVQSSPQDELVHQPLRFPIDAPNGYVYEDEEEDEEEEEEEEDYDYDEDLGSKWMDNLYGSPRMKKLGKRACPKMMSKTKRLPCYYYKRPSYVLGKPPPPMYY